MLVDLKHARKVLRNLSDRLLLQIEALLAVKGLVDGEVEVATELFLLGETARAPIPGKLNFCVFLLLYYR